MGHCKINQMVILIADAILDIDYLWEQINLTARTWYTALIDPENTSSFYYKQRIPTPFFISPSRDNNTLSLPYSRL